MQAVVEALKRFIEDRAGTELLKPLLELDEDAPAVVVLRLVRLEVENQRPGSGELELV